MERSSAVVVTVSVPDRACGERIAAEVVGARTAACAKVSGPVASTFRWEGRVTTEEEWLVSIVSAADRLGDLSKVIRSVHPYEVPEIVATPVVDGDADYLRWVLAETEAS